ncbi:hypothetical protein CKA38_10730 [Ereboglobus luteus]|uniref:alpha-L-rhamnosidase n=2 Tax=Ereboglobus luteus TaxID=1796921 RepID=A0A2U8E564_9BACT|nr:hypothetical protein CKA38_10730 [Ereboglobus luteus]
MRIKHRFMFRIGTMICKTCVSRHAFAAVAMIVTLFAFASAARATLAVDSLRCENLESPLGIDSDKPRFSWRISSPERGENQVAYEILAATNAERLARDYGDLWNSGRVTSSETLNIPYNGRPLATSQQVFWKVRAWSNAPGSRASEWSPVATFTTGVLDTPLGPGWQPGAQWITDPELLKWERKAFGFCSREGKHANAPKWVQLDLGSPQSIDTVILRAVRHGFPDRHGFPVRFKIEASDDPAFKKAHRIHTISDDTANDLNPRSAVIMRTPPATHTAIARYLRVTATKLRAPADGKPVLALSQIEVLSGPDKKNIAVNAPVTASDISDDSVNWQPGALTDGLDTSDHNPRANTTLLLRRKFNVRPGLVRALAHITGLGHYEFSVGCTRITTGLLAPGWTNYDKTVLYDTYDITSRLHEGSNVLALILSGGFYNIRPDPLNRYHKFTTPFRPLAAYGQIRLEYDDGLVETISTDGAWRVSTGPATYSNLYGGEDYDARLEPRGWTDSGFDDSAWTPAATTPGPAGKFRGLSLASPHFNHFEKFSPVSEKQIRDGVSIIDFGQNASMMPSLTVRGPAGSIVRLTPAELVDPDTGALDRRSVGGGAAYWQYTLRGDPFGESWTPDTYYHGTRYIQVERIPPDGGQNRPVVEKIKSLVTHSDTPTAGDFACSDELFNRIRTLVRWAQRSNLAHVLTDCPHREKLGWLEQYHLNGPALRYEWDAARLFAKCFRDMADSQLPSGLVPDIAPEYTIFAGGFRDSPEWGAAFVLAAWQHYIWTADDKPLRDYFDAMDDYVDYLNTRAKKYILSHGLGDWFDSGPRRPGVSQLTPVPLTATAIYYEITHTLARIATVIGREDDASRLNKEAAKIADAFNRAFLNNDGDPAQKPFTDDPNIATYATGSQTAQAMPLALGLVPPERRKVAFDTLVARLQADDYGVTSGDVGYRYLLRALANNGRSDLIHKMLTRGDEKPGYAYQLAQGATSLTEAWNARRQTSQNHFMLGQVTEWFYGDLVGVQPDPEGPGFRKIFIKPQVVGDITWARATYESPRGPVACAWKKEGGKFVLKISIPTGSTATVHIPTKNPATVREGGVAVANAKGVRALHDAGANNKAVYTIESGNYIFTAEQ